MNTPEKAHMDRDSLILQLAVSEKFAWRTSHQQNESPMAEMVKWIPIASLITKPGTPALCLGLSSTGHWLCYSQAQGTVFDFEAAAYYWWLFPLLEMSHHDAKEMLLAEFRKHWLNQAWISYFPFHYIIAAALESDSKYWPDLALDWVPSLTSSPRIVEALRALKQRGRTQQQRHRAMKLLAASTHDQTKHRAATSHSGE